MFLVKTEEEESDGIGMKMSMRNNDSVESWVVTAAMAFSVDIIFQ